MSRDQIIREMLEPCGGEPSKLEWLAYWLDGMDSVISEVLNEPQGHDVRDDLRRWAKGLRGSNAS